MTTFTPMEESILHALYESRHGRPVDTEQLFRAVYGNRADGGPEWGLSTVRRQILLLRPKVREMGCDIVCWAKQGYKLVRRGPKP